MCEVTFIKHILLTMLGEVDCGWDRTRSSLLHRHWPDRIAEATYLAKSCRSVHSISIYGIFTKYSSNCRR